MTLLSGRSCSQIFHIEKEDIEDVLRQSAALLDMDVDTVVRNGTLMIGSIDIKDLKDCALNVANAHLSIYDLSLDGVQTLAHLEFS